MKKVLELTLTLAIAAGLALPAAAGAGPDAAPASIVDTWSRTVTAADAKRRGAVTTGPWRLVVTRAGAMSLFNGSSRKAVVTGKLTAAAAGSLRMLDLRVAGGGRCTEQATYRWRMTGGRLTLTTTADKCPGRAAVLVGTWRRA